MFTFDEIKVKEFEPIPLMTPSNFLKSHPNSLQVSDDRYLGTDGPALNDAMHLSKIETLSAGATEAQRVLDAKNESPE